LRLSVCHRFLQTVNCLFADKGTIRVVLKHTNSALPLRKLGIGFKSQLRRQGCFLKLLNTSFVAVQCKLLLCCDLNRLKGCAVINVVNPNRHSSDAL